ncbi:nucleotidyltransferase family protein [Chloroflexia bacterium SDU3-3]|nr:nucleotidyltransferase family protein [Chloroflexia bacterium SDU3-3]
MHSHDRYHQELASLLLPHPWFRPLLETVRALALPDWFIGAGVIRTLVWDHLHSYAAPTPLADVDVVFFDPADLRPARDAEVQAMLVARRPDVPWEATNQAAVHLWYESAFGFAVPPLASSADGVGTWPETATSVGVRLLPDDTLEIAAPCGLEDLFQLTLRRNPRRISEAQFRERVRAKRIRERWPRVQVIDG